jgi:cytoskeleton protein RodZ
MTTNNPTRRSRRGGAVYGPNSNGHGNGHISVGDRLRDAREVRGLDLYRVERDTKIRHKYLSALESGDYADLPGDVYARGFLRNYATYLGLDPDEVVDEWRRESGPSADGTSPMLGAPRPMAVPRRGFFLQTSHLVLVAVVLIVAIVGVYFGYQVTRFLSYPTLAVGCPGESPSASGVSISTGDATSCYVSAGSVHITAAMNATTYSISGTATAGATVSIVWNGQDAKIVQADDGGNWSYQAILAPGQNEFDVTAQNIDTNHASKTAKIFVYVPTPTATPTSPVVAFTSPTDGTIFADGKLTIEGTSSFVTDVSLTVTYLGIPPAPGATLSPDLYNTPAPSISPGASGSVGPSVPVTTATPSAVPTATSAPSAESSAPAPPPPVSTPVDDKGAFSFPLTLETGTWRLSITGQDSHGVKSATVSRVVAVPFTGVVVGISITGSDGSWILVLRDGASVVQGTYLNGWTRTETGKKNVCIRAGKPSNVHFTVNGIDMGTVAQYGGSRVLIDATHPPKNVSSC